MHNTMNSLDQEMIFSSDAEEILVVDERGKVRPSEQVERKLVAMLNMASLPVSQLHQTHQLRRRYEV